MFKKFGLPFLLIQAVGLIIYTILVFAVGDKTNFSNGAFITSYIFVIAIVVLNFLMLFYVDKVKKHDKSINEAYYFYPVHMLAFIVYLVISIIFFFANPSSVKGSVVTYSILTVIYLAYAILICFVVKTQSENREKIRKKVNFIRLVTSDVAAASDVCEDNEVKQLLVTLSEDVRFSDPMSDDSLAQIEDNIFTISGELKDLATNKQYDDLKVKIDEMSKLIKERNRKCKILK